MKSPFREIMKDLKLLRKSTFNVAAAFSIEEAMRIVKYHAAKHSKKKK